MPKPTAIVPVERIEQTILYIRGHRVILDNDLARMYGTNTKALNQAVKRNAERFPEDFMFRLSAQEKEEVVTNCDHLRQLRFSPNRPLAFTEHGAIMAATVLNSKRAIEASLYVVRAFVRMRKLLAGNQDLAKKIAALESKFEDHDKNFAIVFQAIRELMEPPIEEKKGKLGFHKPSK